MMISRMIITVYCKDINAIINQYSHLTRGRSDWLSGVDLGGGPLPDPQFMAQISFIEATPL